MKTITIHAELEERIRLNAARLQEAYYQLPDVFAPPEYRSFGDKEGRALWAFLCHRTLTGEENPCLRPMLAALPAHTNAGGFFGPIHTGRDGDVMVDEFQFGGSTWYLRALCEAHRQLGDNCIPGTTPLALAKRVFEGLYLPALGLFDSYPVDHEELTGDMFGNELRVGNWILCSDIGAAFLGIDGVADYYIATGDVRAYDLVREMTECFARIDKLKIKAQTHATLSAVRGLLRMYEHTGDKRFADVASDTWNLYITQGMTATYANFNWFGRGETWTEPCAVVDSLIVALHMYRLFGKQRNLILARRIWHNGMSSGQRSNGGAGTDTCVTPHVPFLHTGNIYEAYFCCTMRLSEGFLWAKQNEDLLSIEIPDLPLRDNEGRYMAGDLIYGEISPADEAGSAVQVDGHTLSPLPKVFRLSEIRAVNTQTQVIFTE